MENNQIVIQETEINISNEVHKSIVRKITFNEADLQKAALIASHSYSKAFLDGKTKPDELISKVIADALNYYYNKILTEIK